VKSPLVPITAAAIVAMLCAGCSSSGSQNEQTSNSLASTREGIVNTKTQIDKTVGSLQKLMAIQSGDMSPAYKEFASNVSSMNKLGESVTKRANAMKEQGAKHFKSWEQESAGMKNPEIQALSAERKQEVQASYQKLTESMTGARDAFTPLLSDLNDIQKYLKNDLNPGGVEKIRPIAERVAGNGATVDQNLDQIIGVLDEVSAKIAPKM
jgi:ABC-type transporter Mla subunit MlaD